MGKESFVSVCRERVSIYCEDECRDHEGLSTEGKESLYCGGNRVPNMRRHCSIKAHHLLPWARGGSAEHRSERRFVLEALAMATVAAPPHHRTRPVFAMSLLGQSQ